MPWLRSDLRGDLHAHVEVMVPQKLDARTRELLTEMKSRSTEQAAVKMTCTTSAQAGGGGLFSRLRKAPAADHSALLVVATLFYAETVPAVGGLVVVEGDEGFHAATVRRIRPGSRW